MLENSKNIKIVFMVQIFLALIQSKDFINHRII